MSWIKSIFKKPKYEVMALMSHERYIDEKMEALQNEGWELCGELLVKNKTGHCTDTYLFVPLKRRIK